MDHFATGVLDRNVHARLVADIHNIAADAGIPDHWISQPLAHTCSPQEVAWAKAFKHHAGSGLSGLLLFGKHPDPDAETRMFALAGALTRTFIRCRVMPLHVMLANANNNDIPDVSCLLVPNFCIGPAKGNANLAWRHQVMLDVLLARRQAGKQTVLYATALQSVVAEFGEGVRQHLAANFVQASI